MVSRAEVNQAWLEGRKAGLEGKGRASNPYVGKNSDLAKAWDQGWQSAH